MDISFMYQCLTDFPGQNLLKSNQRIRFHPVRGEFRLNRDKAIKFYSNHIRMKYRRRKIYFIVLASQKGLGDKMW